MIDIRPTVSQAQSGARQHARDEVRVRWLGRRPYGPVLELQHRLVAQARSEAAPDRLLMVEHDPVITLGRRADPAHVLVDTAELARRGVERFAVERGGAATYHGPGQLVAYPILNLRRYRTDVRWYSHRLLETVVAMLATLGLDSEARHGDETGVWIPGPDGGAKIAALGVRIQGWVTSHGVAINVDPDLTHYQLLVPCGLHGRPVTSIREQLGSAPTLARAIAVLEAAFASMFEVRLVAEAEDPAAPEPAGPGLR